MFPASAFDPAPSAPYTLHRLNQGYDIGFADHRSVPPPPPYSAAINQQSFSPFDENTKENWNWLAPLLNRFFGGSGDGGGTGTGSRTGRSSQDQFLNAASAAKKSLGQTVQAVRQHSTFVLLCGLWYMSSAMSSNTGKSIMNQFRYPVTLSFAQFAFVAGYSALLCAVRGGRGIPRPSRTALKGTFAMSMFQIGGHVLTSMAIARVPVSTVHTIKALSPLFTVLSYASLFRVRYSAATYWALLPLTLGVMLACSFNMRANAAGLSLSLGSTMVFVSQNIFSKKLLPKDDSSSHAASPTKLDKLELLLFSSAGAFLFMIPIWLWSDGGALLSAWIASSPSDPNALSVTAILWLFFANGTVHFLQNFLAFALLSRTSPVTYSIASLIKRIAVICIAIVWFQQRVTFAQTVGIGLTGYGLFRYNQCKNDVNAQHQKHQKRESIVLPSTKADI